SDRARDLGYFARTTENRVTYTPEATTPLAWARSGCGSSGWTGMEACSGITPLAVLCTLQAMVDGQWMKPMMGDISQPAIPNQRALVERTSGSAVPTATGICYGIDAMEGQMRMWDCLYCKARMAASLWPAGRHPWGKGGTISGF